MSGPEWPGQMLQLGDSGDDVRTWQEQMQRRTWRISTGGDFDDLTDSVCRRFQEEKGLLVDGVVGPITWDAAWNLPVTPGPSHGGSGGGGSGGAPNLHFSTPQLNVSRNGQLISVSGTVTNHGSTTVPASAAYLWHQVVPMSLGTATTDSTEALPHDLAAGESFAFSYTTGTSEPPNGSFEIMASLVASGVTIDTARGSWP